MQIIDDRIYGIFRDMFNKYLPDNRLFQQWNVDIEQFVSSWFMDVTNHVNTMFVCLPGIEGIEWPDDIKKLF